MQYALKKRLFAFIAENIGLEVLDLSWNRFRGKSAVEIVDGIKVFLFTSFILKSEFHRCVRVPSHLRLCDSY